MPRSDGTGTGTGTGTGRSHLFFHLKSERRLDNDSRVDKKGPGSPDLGNAKPTFFTR